MSVDYTAPLSDLLTSIPGPLEDYFTRIRNGDCSHKEQHGINLLPPSEAVGLTRQFREFHPLIQLTDAIILDDANTSNYHCYAPDLPVPGGVFYLNHDGDTRVVFGNQDELVDAANQAKESDGWLEDFHKEIGPLAEDQGRLNQRISELFHSQHEDGEAAILLFIESSDFSDTNLFKTLAADSNFYFGEAIAKTILARPQESLTELAEICSQHKHPQVSRPGAKALAAVQQLRR